MNNIFPTANNEEKDYQERLDNLFKSLMLSYKASEEHYRRELVSLFQPLILSYQLASTIEEQANEFLASDFNIVGIFSPEENTISDILASLLHPRGKHGQGRVFLLKFLEVLREKLGREFLNLEEIDLSKVKIIREYSTDKGRRIDILIRFPDGFVIGIENKPWAGEQYRQLEDYNKYLETISSSGEGSKYLLIYLDGWGREATSIDRNLKETLKEEGKFLETSYRELLIPWLKQCYKECKSEKVRWFLLDFITWIEKTFKGGLEDG